MRGILIWNIIYDAMLKLPITADREVIGFADDIAVVILAKYLDKVKQICKSSPCDYQIVSYYEEPVTDKLL